MATPYDAGWTGSAQTGEDLPSSVESSYVYCLDAWLQGAPVEVAAAELEQRRDTDRERMGR